MSKYFNFLESDKNTYLNEAIEGEEEDNEPDDYNMDEDEETENPDAGGEDDNYDVDEGEEPPEEDAGGEDDNYDVDADETSDTDPQDTDNQNTEEIPEPEHTDDTGGDEYDMGDDATNNTEGDDNEGEGSEAPPDDDEEAGEDEYTLDDNDAGSTSDNDNPDDNTDPGDDSSETDEYKEKLLNVEKQLFDQLSEDQKKIKIKELKNNYSKLYARCADILEVITRSNPGDDSIIKVFDYVQNTVTNLQTYVYNYMVNSFDSKTYLENDAQFKQFLTILNTIKNILNEINITKEK